jgi:hypothetical protein
LPKNRLTIKRRLITLADIEFVGKKDVIKAKNMRLIDGNPTCCRNAVYAAGDGDSQI